MQGEEFTQRLLTPFEEGKLTLLLRQGYDVDALLRLMGAEIRLQDAATAGIDRSTTTAPRTARAIRSSAA